MKIKVLIEYLQTLDGEKKIGIYDNSLQKIDSLILVKEAKEYDKQSSMDYTLV